MPFPEIPACASVIIVAAYVIFGVSGFSSALVAVPLFAHFMPPSLPR